VAVGDSQSHQYCFIEFEDATRDSIFKKKGKKATLDWSDRFEHGCSQIIDWLLWLENQKNTNSYLQLFGVGEVHYIGLLKIGRDKFLADPSLRQRLTWRSEQVVVCSRKLHCITFDKLYQDLTSKMAVLSGK
jgi:Shedu protein SduA, C-terminal